MLGMVALTYSHSAEEVRTDRLMGLAGQLDSPTCPAPGEERDPVSETKLSSD